MPSNGYKCPNSSEQDPTLKVPDKYKDHPSIKLIKAKWNSQVFKFSQIDIEEVKKSFQRLDPKKAAQKDGIKTNVLKENVDFLQNTHVMTSMIHFFLQNFLTNSNKQTSYLHTKKVKAF